MQNLFRRYKKLRRIFRELKADVVLSTIGKNNFMAILANLFSKTRVIVSVVAEPTEEYPNALMRFLAKTLFYLADGIVMQTKDAVAFFQPSLQKKCVILKNSVNPAFLRPRYEGKRGQDIVAVGRMDANKNQAMAIRAFAKIAGEFPESRLILYGDGPLKEQLKALADGLGVGDRVLLPGTVAENVAQRRSEDGIDRDKVEQCLAQAGLEQKIASLPSGLDTKLVRVIYDDAEDLSGGETQRLMLARALYKNGPVLVLDEPTAALDPIAEDDIYQKYNEMTAGCTSVFISHRLASTRFCDRIILLDHGAILEEGTHEELMKKDGRYAQLFQVQSRYYQKGAISHEA